MLMPLVVLLTNCSDVSEERLQTGQCQSMPLRQKGMGRRKGGDASCRQVNFSTAAMTSFEFCCITKP
jgi:hypothetical protein